MLLINESSSYGARCVRLRMALNYSKNVFQLIILFLYRKNSQLVYRIGRRCDNYLTPPRRCVVFLIFKSEFLFSFFLWRYFNFTRFKMCGNIREFVNHFGSTAKNWRIVKSYERFVLSYFNESFKEC